MVRIVILAPKMPTERQQIEAAITALEAQIPRRIIVFDMPPLMVTDDVLAFAPRVDTFLLVVSQGQTARRTLANAKEVLSEVNLMGVVLNRSTERNDSPYY